MARALRAAGVRVGVCLAPQTGAAVLAPLLALADADGWLVELGDVCSLLTNLLQRARVRTYTHARSRTHTRARARTHTTV